MRKETGELWKTLTWATVGATIFTAAVVPGAREVLAQTNSLDFSSLIPRRKGDMAEASAPVPTDSLPPTPVTHEDLVQQQIQKATATPVPPVSTTVQEAVREVKTGSELIDRFGLRGKIVYFVYGRPGGWGSLGETRTAEQAWDLFLENEKKVIGDLGLDKDGVPFTQKVALRVLNPDYFSGVALTPAYIEKALELACLHDGLVGLSFDNLDEAYNGVRKTIDFLPQERRHLLSRLAVSLDIEHFPGGAVSAQKLNEFVSWFAQARKSWPGHDFIPGLVFAYTFGKGVINDLPQLTQYHLEGGILVPVIFDGYGRADAKLPPMKRLVTLLRNSTDFPAAVGVMEFWDKWGSKYDKVITQKSAMDAITQIMFGKDVKDLNAFQQMFLTLYGAQIYFFASQ